MQLNNLEELLKSGIEDEQLNDLLTLKDHPGFRRYLTWIEAELKRENAELLRSTTTWERTNLLRGKIIAYNLAIDGIIHLIQQREEEIQSQSK